MGLNVKRSSYYAVASLHDIQVDKEKPQFGSLLLALITTQHVMPGFSIIRRHRLIQGCYVWF